MTERIYFYDKNAPFYCFTNFSPHPVTLKGKVWPTSEHYFQAQKFAGSPLEEEVRLLPTPRDAFNFSRTNRSKSLTNWMLIRNAVMREAVEAKFTQHDDLREILLLTGDAILVEHTANDNYWGDGSGQNMLGKILMEVREKLRAARPH